MIILYLLIVDLSQCPGFMIKSAVIKHKLLRGRKVLIELSGLLHSEEQSVCRGRPCARLWPTYRFGHPGEKPDSVQAREASFYQNKKA